MIATVAAQESAENSLNLPAFHSLQREFHTFLQYQTKTLCGADCAADAVLELSNRSKNWWDRQVAILDHGEPLSKSIEFEVARSSSSPTDRDRRGILLLGGNGSRLEAYTGSLNKHLLPIYDRPACFYSLSTLMATGVRDIAVVTTPTDEKLIRELCGDGSAYGISLTYVVQPRPDGIADALRCCQKFLDGAPSALMLGDTIIYGNGLTDKIRLRGLPQGGARGFAVQVPDPFHFDVVDFSSEGLVAGISLKPEIPRTNWITSGLFLYDRDLPTYVSTVTRSLKNEFQLYDVTRQYLDRGLLTIARLDPKVRWFDIGREESLFAAAQQVAADTFAGAPLPCNPQRMAILLGYRNGLAADLP